MIAVDTLKDWLPPRVVRWGRGLAGRSLRFSGPAESWGQASRISTGYLEGSILDRVADATRQVIAGKAVFERDGVVFDRSDFSYPLISSLLYAAATNQGRLDVIDFGGALGSTYRQCQPFLRGLERVKWQVIEQPNYVDLGRREFETAELTFYSSAGQLPVASNVKRVLLLSSVLQYLENPFRILNELMTLPLSHIIIDRTPISEQGQSRLYVQKVPPSIYHASYPCWILAKKELMAVLSVHWDELCGFPCLDGRWTAEDGLDFEFRGYFFLPKNIS